MARTDEVELVQLAPRIPKSLVIRQVPRLDEPEDIYVRMLWDALIQAGLAPSHGHPRPALRALARRWLAGELEAEVAPAVKVVCTMLGIDAGMLAAAVRARATP
jgi:hypothetical protein